MSTIYIDLLALENFIINYLILFTAAFVSGEHVSRVRLCLGALIGGIYSVCVYLPQLGQVAAHPAVKVMVGVLMCLIAYGGKRYILKLTLVFFGCALAFAGGVFAVSFLTGGSTFFHGVSTKTLVMSLCVMFVAALLVFGRFAKHGGIRRDTKKCRFMFRGRESQTVAFVDTGNTLHDPISGASVIVADRDVFLALLDRETAKIIEISGDIYSAIEKVGGGGLRIVPYNTVSGSGAMLVLRPDKVLIGEKEVKNVLVGMSPEKVAKGTGCGALVGEI